MFPFKFSFFIAILVLVLVLLCLVCPFTRFGHAGTTESAIAEIPPTGGD